MYAPDGDLVGKRHEGVRFFPVYEKRLARTAQLRRQASYERCAGEARSDYDESRIPAGHRLANSSARQRPYEKNTGCSEYPNFWLRPLSGWPVSSSRVYTEIEDHPAWDFTNLAPVRTLSIETGLGAGWDWET